MFQEDTPDVTEPVFSFDGYRYEIYATHVKHSDYDTLYQAWRTNDTTNERSMVVMKRFLVPNDGERMERAWEELQIATHLSHPNIATVDSIARSPDGAVYIVMETMPGLYLATALDFALLVGRKPSPAFAAYVASMVADALDHAHSRKDTRGNALHIIHRAVGPMRVRLGYDGRVKLVNFGAAYSELRDRLKTPPGVLRGDAAYAAPELWRAVMASPGARSDPLISGIINGRADVFSLGLLFVETLLADYPLDPTDVPEATQTPRVPVRVKTERPTWIEAAVLAERVLRFDVEQLDNRLEPLPKELREVVRRALQHEPSERFTAGQMRDRLRAYLANLRRPFDDQAMSEELVSIYSAAKKAQRWLAIPTERTALSSREQ